jgi:hypothetical protein
MHRTGIVDRRYPRTLSIDANNIVIALNEKVGEALFQRYVEEEMKEVGVFREYFLRR